MLSDFLTRSHTDCSVKEFAVQPADIGYLQDFIEHWHYSNNVTGLRADYNFGLYHQNDLIGAIVGRASFGRAILVTGCSCVWHR